MDPGMKKMRWTSDLKKKKKRFPNVLGAGYYGMFGNSDTESKCLTI